MRSFSIVHILLLLVFLLAYQCAHAQDFIITTKGDSLTGDTRVFNFGSEWKVQLTRPDRTKAIYNVFQVREFSERNEIYHPVKFREGYVFMKLLKRGYLSLYAFQQPEQGTFDGRYLLKRDSKGVEVPNLNYKKTMSNFLSDCPTVSEKISAGGYGRKDLYLLIDDYNACIDAQTTVKDNTEPVVKRTIPQAWDDLHSKVTDHADFEGKTDALEMITEVRKKISHNEKVPNFLTTGLKSILEPTDLKADLDKALADLAQ